jgi:glycerol-3-phosphate O-acyltransferase/dihydroxyacetone phosphate acyltransferase
MLAYRLLVQFLSLVTSVFFRTIEVVGLEHIARDAPVIFVGNHPNSLLDPLLVVTTCRRRLSFAAKDSLFKGPLPIRVVLKVMGAVPVKRRMDHATKSGGAAPLDNESMFAALFDVLEQGGACGIFPEGISHSGSELAPLKTGAARIALGASKRNPQRPVHVVPCGLSYHRRTRMRGQVLVQFGPPLVIDAGRLSAHEADERGAVRALTDDIDAALRALTINASDFRTLHVLDTVRRLYVPPGERLSLAQRGELSRRFLSRYESIQSEAPVRELYEAVSRYADDLEALGLSDAQLSEPPSRGRWCKRVLRHLGLIVFLAPLALPGFLLHSPLLLAAVIAGEGLTPRKDVIATTKMMVLTLLVPLVYGLILGVVLLTVAPPGSYYLAGTLGVLLPMSGLATIRVLERQAALRRGVVTLFSLLVLPRAIERLRQRREELRQRIWSAVEAYAPPDMQRMFESE